MISSVFILLVVGSCCLVALSVAMPPSVDDMFGNSIVDEDAATPEEELFDSVFDLSGPSYADTPAKLEALGIDTRSIHPSILEDSKLLVVSDGRAVMLCGSEVNQLFCHSPI